MKIKNLLPLLGLALFLGILYRVGFVEVYHNLISIKLWYVPLIILISLVNAVVMSYKWGLFLNYQGVFLSLYNKIRINLASYFYGVITPMRIGYFFKIKLLKDRANLSLGESLPSILLDRIFDFFWMFVLAIASTLYLIHIKLNFFSKFYIYFEMGFLVLLIFSMWFFLNKKRSGNILKIIYRLIIPNKYKDAVRESFNHFYINVPKKRKLIYPGILGLFNYFLFFSEIYVIAIALNIKISYIDFIVIYPFIMIFSLIPITIGGLGTRDAASIILLGLFGVSASQAIALSLLTFIFIDFLIGGIGLVFSLRQNDSINNNSVS